MNKIIGSSFKEGDYLGFKNFGSGIRTNNAAQKIDTRVYFKLLYAPLGG